MAADKRDLVGSILGECELEKVIGQGGMSSVYLGRQRRPARYVAVKVLGSQISSNSAEDYQMFLTRFRREADIVATLEHANIIPLYAYGEEKHYAYIIMPYISGGSLSDAISKHGQLSLQQTFVYLQQAAAALDYAHARNIVHRDLKPSNFLLYPDNNRLVLADFGIARIAAANPYATQETTLTQAGATPGTLAYMAPEMLRDSKNIDYRVDIYALGIVLYQMLTGEHPFTGDLFAVINKHLSEPLPPLHKRNPAIPAAIDDVLNKATAKNREERYATAGDLFHDFCIAMDAASIGNIARMQGWDKPGAPETPAPDRNSFVQPAYAVDDTLAARGETARTEYSVPVRDNVVAEGNSYPSLTSQSGSALPPPSRVYRGVRPAEPSAPNSSTAAQPQAFPSLTGHLLQYPVTDRRNEENLPSLPTSPDVGDSNRMMSNRSSGFALGSALPPPPQGYRGARPAGPLASHTSTTARQQNYEHGGAPRAFLSRQSSVMQDVSGAEHNRYRRHGLRRAIMTILIAIVLLVGLSGYWLISTHRVHMLPPPQPVAGPPASVSEAEHVIQEYYEDINEHNYRAAFNLLTPEFQRYLGYSKFVSGYANTKHDDISFGEAREVSDGNVSVVTAIRALEARPQGDVTTPYHITYTVVRTHGDNANRGTWKIQGGVST